MNNLRLVGLLMKPMLLEGKNEREREREREETEACVNMQCEIEMHENSHYANLFFFIIYYFIIFGHDTKLAFCISIASS